MGVANGVDAGVGVKTENAGAFELFFDGVRSETCLNFKRYGRDGVRNSRIFDFLSLGMALSSRNSPAFLSFLGFSLVNGDEKSAFEEERKDALRDQINMKYFKED